MKSFFTYRILMEAFLRGIFWKVALSIKTSVYGYGKLIQKFILKRKKVLVALFLTLLSLTNIANIIVLNSSHDAVFSDTRQLTKNKVGIVLGTSKFTSDGTVNLFYRFRIEAAAELYKSKKVSYLILSGDNGTVAYNEPIQMKNDLIRLGVPPERIFLDYAGFRTLDTVIRAKEVFGQEQVVFISQEFHNKRAIYLAKSKGIAAVGFNAKDVGARYGFKIYLREYAARVKAVADIVFNAKPKYLGPKVIID